MLIYEPGQGYVFTAQGVVDCVHSPIPEVNGTSFTWAWAGPWPTPGIAGFTASRGDPYTASLSSRPPRRSFRDSAGAVYIYKCSLPDPNATIFAFCTFCDPDMLKGEGIDRDSPSHWTAR
jgi:hypothetical protein